MNFQDLIQNPRSQTLKRNLAQFLRERYVKNQEIIDRIGYHLATEKDIQDFVNLIVDIFEMGYIKSVDDHKEKLKKLGLESKIVAQENDG